MPSNTATPPLSKPAHLPLKFLDASSTPSSESAPSSPRRIVAARSSGAVRPAIFARVVVIDARLNQPRPQQIALVLSVDAFALERVRAADVVDDDDVDDDDVVDARRAARASATTRDTDASDVSMTLIFSLQKVTTVAAPLAASFHDDRRRRDGRATMGKRRREDGKPKKPPGGSAANPSREKSGGSAPKAVGGNWAALSAKINAGESAVAKRRAAERRAMEDVTGTSFGGRRPTDGGDDAEGKKPKPTGRNTAVTRVLALDCEMVGVGADGKRSILARASIVNEDGNVIMDKFVLPTERVTDYRTAVSGVRPRDVTAENGAVSFKKVQQQMMELLRGRVLVGHSLKNDLRVLMLDHPKKDTRDTSLYHPLTRPLRPEERCVPGAPRGRGCRSLKDLARQHLGFQIQTGEHSSVDDARAALALYKKFAKKWEASVRQSAKFGAKKKK